MNKILTNNFYKQREHFDKMTSTRASSFPMPDGVEEYLNIPYSDDGDPAHRMDIYRPKGKHGSLPVIIDVHGGGLLLGNKEFNRQFCAQLSLMGFLVFSIEFRLIPDVYVYDQFADLSLAMDRIQQLIPDYHGDLAHTYIVGDSGGAYLIIYTLAVQKCPAVAEAARVTPSTLDIKAAGLLSGMFYTAKFDKIGIFLPSYLYGKGYKKSAFAPYVNPEHPDIVRSLPPCYLVTSHNDMLKHYTLNFGKALEKYHMPHELINFPKNEKLTHAFCVFEPFMEESMDAMASMTQFLRQY